MPKLSNKGIMTGAKGFEKSEYINIEVINPQRFNRIWGTDFLIMDGNTFKGGIIGADYERLIDMFVNLWNKY